METIVKKLYEAMFLVDSAEAASDWDGINSTIQRILEKAEAEVVSIRKWDDRRLAYEIGGKSKGVYILCYFRAQGERLGEIERNVQLSERILRVLILSAEDREQADLDKDTPAEKAVRQIEKAEEAAAEAAEKAAQEAKAKAAETEAAVAAEPTEQAEKAEQSTTEDSEAAAADDSAEAETETETEEPEKQADEQGLESS